MKKFIKVLLLTLMFASMYARRGVGNFDGRTFFTVRPPFNQVMPEKISLFRYDRMIPDNCYWGGALQAVVFGGQSINCDQIAEYFLPAGKTSLNVVEFKPGVATADGDPAKDVEARNFNIQTQSVDTTFRSRISFCPQQTMFGIGFTYYQALTYKYDGNVKFWLGISAPVVRVENTMGFCETVLSNGDGAVDELGLDNSPRVGNMTQAFKQSNWKYGRIVKGCKNVKWGLSDIELYVGYNTINEDHCWLNSYFGLVLPTGNRPKARIVFEPIVGNNHHFGIFLGNNLGFKILEKGPHKLSYILDSDSRLLFRNHQRRSFDLIDKQWSRYMETYANKGAAIAAVDASAAGDFVFADNSGTSGINVFTSCFKVKPRFLFNINSAIRYDHCEDWALEVGYNFFARQAESVELCWNPDSALKSVNGLGFTNIAKTIKNNFTDCDIPLADYAPIEKNEIDLDSAAHPGVLSNIIYLTIGYNSTCHDRPIFAAVGGSYEFASINTTLDRWLIWFKAGISF
ncbi:hypothetical protein M1446_05080 [Candidatus Dependentiae bacterium]|nr:hypothetical protein [Candidatus Dependentiae bacterium]